MQQTKLADVTKPRPESCEHLVSYTHLPLPNLWVIDEMETSSGTLSIRGAGSRPEEMHRALWETIIPRLPELTSLAFDALFEPDSARFKNAGLQISPIEVKFNVAQGSFSIVFSVSGFPPGFSVIKPFVIFDAQLQPVMTDWKQDC